MTKQRKQTKTQLSTTYKESFFKLLHKATKPLSQEEDQKKESDTSDDYNAKRTRPRKAEDVSD